MDTLGSDTRETSRWRASKGRRLDMIYAFETWENVRAGGLDLGVIRLLVRQLKSQEDCLGPGGEKNSR